jgi:hypothetical protein
MSGPSWKWMPSRSARNAFGPTDTSPQPTSRPCLPAVEMLGDRILLSVSVEPGGSNENPPPPVDQILIGLLKGELKLATDEIAALKLVGGEDPQALHDITGGFLKIDEVIEKYGEAIIKGELTEQKIKLAQAELDRAFAKIGDIKLAGEALQAALGDIKLDTAGILASLNRVGTVGDLSQKEQFQYLKIADLFGDVDAGLLKLQEAVLARKAGKGQQEYLIIKMNDVIVTSAALTDPQLKASLQDLAGATEKILIGLLQPPTTGDVILT